MGMRTTLILKYEYKNEKYPGRNFTTHRVYYHQWGNGRGLLAQMMAVLNGQICNNVTEEEAVSVLQPQGTLDETSWIKEDEKRSSLLHEVSFENPKAVAKVMRMCGNNSGGAYLHIVVTADKNYDYIYDVKYAFMTGNTVDHGKFARKDSWIRIEGAGYVDKDFRKLFNDTLKYWGAEEMYGKNERRVQSCIEV